MQALLWQNILNLTTGQLGGTGTLTLGDGVSTLTTTRTFGSLNIPTAYNLAGATYNVNYNAITGTSGITTGTELPPLTYPDYQAGTVTINNATANGGVILGINSNINSLTINASTLLDINGKTLGIFGAYTNSGTAGNGLKADAATSTLSFIGTGTQTFAPGILNE